MTSSIEILLIEDNPADVDLIQEQLDEVGTEHRLHVVPDGVDALRFVHRRPPFEERPAPQLILLDLCLPRKDGLEVLGELKQDPALRRIPVIVLSSSRSPSDIRNSYTLHANAYIPKPPDLDGYETLFRRIEAFWMRSAALP